MRSLTTCIATLALVPALLSACDDGVGAPAADVPPGVDVFVDTDGGTDVIVPSCRPNLDSMITAQEMAPAVGIVTHLGVRSGMVPVDVVGVQEADGSWRWDWRQAQPDERVVQVAAESLEGKWYADQFPSTGEGTQFVVDFDLDGEVEQVLRHDDGALVLVGLASSQEAPDEGQTLLIYETPVELFRYPLRAGDAWVSTGTVRNGKTFGLPYAGRDTYVTTVDGQGLLDLEYLGFDQVLRVRTHVTLAPAVGASTSRRQVSWVTECFGEVARATSVADEADDDFTIASEVRRLTLP